MELGKQYRMLEGSQALCTVAATWRAAAMRSGQHAWRSRPFLRACAPRHILINCRKLSQLPRAALHSAQSAPARSPQILQLHPGF